MERSKVPLHKWLYFMYLLVTARKGISSLQLAKEIGVTRKPRGSFSGGCAGLRRRWSGRRTGETARDGRSR